MQRLILVTLGSSATGVWLLDTLFCALSSLLIFFIARRFCASTLLALVAGLSYPLLYYSLGHETPGLPQGWSVVCWLASLHLVTVSAKGRLAPRVALAGALCGIAVSLDPVAALIFPVILISLYLQCSAVQRTGYLSLFTGTAIVFALAPVAWLVSIHVFPEAREMLLGWRLNSSSRQFLAQIQRPVDAGQNLLESAWAHFGWTLPGAVAATAGLIALHRRRYGDVGKLVWLWLLLSALAAFFGGEAQAQRWTVFLPAWCLLGAAGYELMYRRSTVLAWRRFATLLLLVGFVTGLSSIRKNARLTPVEQTLQSAVLPLSAFVRGNTVPGSRVLVWGLAPQIYLSIDRPVGAGMVCAQDVARSKEALDFFLRQFRAHPPKMILLRRPDPGDTYSAPYLPPQLRQLDEFVSQGYVLVDKINGYEVFVRS